MADSAKPAPQSSSPVISAGLLYNAENLAAKVLPYSRYIILAFQKTLPILQQLFSYYEKLAEFLKPYHPEEFLPMFMGFVLAFFGSHFSVLVAAIEAFKMCGWETSKKHFQDLFEDYLVVKGASEKDDLVDDNNDGIADVKQITDEQLVLRKARLYLKSCHPDKISDAMAGIYTGFIGVIATLKIQFSSTITLGAKIGDLTSSVVSMAATPVLLVLVPTEYQKWVPVILKYFCKGIGVWVAWWATTITTSIHSALRGGEQFAKGLSQYSSRTGSAPLLRVRENTIIFSGIMYGVAALGFYWQLSHFFSLPFPLNVLLFPFTFLEGLLRFYISS